MSLKYGLFLSTGFAQELAGIKDPVEAYETLTRWAQTADQSGYDSVWIPDHFLTAPPSQEMVFECWTMAAALARDTKRVRIGQMVAGVQELVIHFSDFSDATHLDAVRRFAKTFIV